MSCIRSVEMLRIRWFPQPEAVERLAVSIGAGIFLVVCLWYVYGAVLAISQHNEISPPMLSRPIHGPHVLAHEFTARGPRLGKLYIFVDGKRLPSIAQEILVFELVDVVRQAVVQRQESTVGQVTFVLGDALALVPGWAVEPGHRYALRFSLPATPEKRGLSFVRKQRNVKPLTR